MSKWFEPEEMKNLLGDELEDENTSRPSPSSESEFSDVENEETIDSPKEQIEVKSMKFEDFSDDDALGEKAGFELLYDIPLEVRVVLGSVVKTVEDIMNLEEGSIVELEKLAGELVEVMVSDQVIAKGEIVIIDDKFGVLITEVVPPRERIKTLENKLKRQRI